MARVEADPDPPSIDLTAMIDVIFILLIFWMTVTRLAETQRPLDAETPLAGALPTSEVSRELLTVNLLSDGRTVMVDDRRMSVDELVDLLGWAPRPEHLLVRAAARTDCAHLAHLAAVLSGAGLERIGLAAREDDP